jgi:hypothetical protein
MIEGSGSGSGSCIRISDQWIRIQEAQKHLDSTGPDPVLDPQHWYKHVQVFINKNGYFV